MADSEAPGDSRLEDPADDRVDTDPLAVVVPETEPWDTEFPYEDGAWHEPEPVYADDHFDAFNTNTWTFKAPPTPWYRTKLAAPALLAVAVAVVALVVSVVLLAFTGPADEKDAPAADPSPTTTASTTTTTAAVTTTEVPPPPLPPPPPPESASSVQVPGGTVRPRPRQTKPPEIGVTRTPVTRSQISASPQPRTPR